MNTLKDTVSERIKALRIKKGVSRKELAFALSVSYNTITAWENGSFVPLASKLAGLANFFCVTVDFLLGLIG